MSEQWRIGELIQSQYRIRAINKGGMGVVFICHDHENDKTVAIKTYRDIFLNDNISVERFLAEAETWIKLGRHRNIVRAFYVAMLAYRPYIIMEYVQGHEIYGADLSAWIVHGKLFLSTILNFAVQFCIGMIHAEKTFERSQRPFVHRDIKPSNILITSTGTIKITDFGISLALSGEDMAAGCGTPTYMSPEQIEDPIHVDTRSDIFSFGRVLEEMAGSLDQKDFPKRFRDCIHHCLEPHPSDRYRNFSELKDVLLNIYFTTFKEPCSAAFDMSEEIETKADILNKGASFINLGMPADAAACCHEVLSTPGAKGLDYKALCVRGIALADRKMKKAAFEAYTKAIAMCPWLPFAYALRGNLLNDADRLPDAMEDYDKALELDDEQAVVHYNRGLCCVRMGLSDDALEEFSRAIELGLAAARLNRGKQYLGNRMFNEALLDFEEAIEANPRDAAAYLNIGIIHEARSDVEDALTFYNRSIKANPHYLAAYYRRGLLFCMQLNLIEDAIEDFEIVLRSDPNACARLSGGLLKLTENDLNRIYYNTYRDIGISCYLLGKWDRANRYLRKYLEFPAIEKDGLDVIAQISDAVRRIESKS